MTVAAETPARRTPRWLTRHETLLAVILIVALAGLGAFNDRFLTLDNLLNQGRLMTEIGLIALPMTFVIITGGIDLSVGAIVGLCAIMLGYSWKTFGFPLPLAIVFALIVGGLAGLVNGLVITRIKVPPLIMTIATLALYRGLAEGVSQAHSVRGYPEWFYFLGQGSLFGVPTQLLALVVLVVVFGIALDRTTFGRTLYVIGANETAARFSALNVDRAKLIVYTLSGLASELAAFVLVSRVTTTRMDMGLGYELDVIAAVVLGGTSIFGGSGTIWGTAIGVAMISALEERTVVDGRQGGRDNRRHRRGAHSLGAGRKLAASAGLRKHEVSRVLGGEAGRKRIMKSKHLLTTAAAFALAAWATGANAAGKWDGADDLPTSPLACGAGAEAASAPMKYDGGQPTNPPDKAGKPISLVDVPKLIGIGYFNADLQGHAGRRQGTRQRHGEDRRPDRGQDRRADPFHRQLHHQRRRRHPVLRPTIRSRSRPVSKKALSKGIHVVGYDATATSDAREWFVQQAPPNGIAKAMLDAMAKEAGEDGAFGIVTSTFTTPNQARWIAEMQAYSTKCHPKMQVAGDGRGAGGQQSLV